MVRRPVIDDGQPRPASAGAAFQPLQWSHAMRAEIEAIVDEIKQGMALLRRHL
jgi:hypothetical protein